jgi:peptidoglycan hydrolase CwlO-like protein
MAKDLEQAIEDVKGKKFGVSINTIIAIVTFLSTVIAGWYSFTARIDSLEEVVQGFAEASDIEIVTNNFNNIDEELKYLREKVDGLKTPKVKSYDGDIIKLQNEIDKLKGEISRLEKLLIDPLADFK